MSDSENCDMNITCSLWCVTEDWEGCCWVRRHTETENRFTVFWLCFSVSLAQKWNKSHNIMQNHLNTFLSYFHDRARAKTDYGKSHFFLWQCLSKSYYKWMKLFGIFVIFPTVYEWLINDSTKLIKSTEKISFHFPLTLSTIITINWTSDIIIA